MMKSGDQILSGDVLRTWFNGGQAQVKSVRPYKGPLLNLIGEGSQIASFRGISLEMTLEAKCTYEVIE